MMNKLMKLILVMISIFLFLISGCIEEQKNNEENQQPGNQYIKYYTNITVEDAKELINSTINLTIIDCRNQPVYEWIKISTWSKNPEEFYNYTGDILVYSQNGGFSAQFCNNLINHTFGNLYNLEGGIEAWKNKGYITQNPYTTNFSNLSAYEARELIDNSTNLTIIDCRACKCKYDDDHIPNAIWDTVASTYYFTTDDLLIYCDIDEYSIEFANRLLGKTYGNIYYLTGSMDAWKEAGYDVE